MAKKKIKKIVKVKNLKYKIIDESAEVNGTKLYRIEALKDFADVKTGDKGGFVETEDNLSQRGKSWIYDDSKVYGNAVVRGDAKVCESSTVSGKIKVYGDKVVNGGTNLTKEVKVKKEKKAKVKKEKPAKTKKVKKAKKSKKTDDASENVEASATEVEASGEQTSTDSTVE